MNGSPPNRRAVFVALLLLSLLDTSAARAQRVVHRARFGETLASIAKHYYGKKDFANFIKLTNGRDDSPVRAGERIRVPTSWFYVTPKRAKLQSLAKRLLGRRIRSVALLAFNTRLQRRRAVPKGTKLLVPFNINHLVTAGETFAAISIRYYGSASNARLISNYNGLRGTQPAAQTSLQVPIGRVRIRRERLLALTNDRVLGVSPSRQRADRAALQEANGMLRRGESWRVPLRLIRLLAREQASDTYIAEVYKLLAVAYVAIDQPSLAVRAFQEALLRQPNMTLDPVTHSPKVIRAFTEAKSRR